jgi:hypothetical protein
MIMINRMRPSSTHCSLCDLYSLASFTSLKQLQEHMDAYNEAYNDKAQPFVWTKKKVRQRRFKGRRVTHLRFRVLGPTN